MHDFIVWINLWCFLSHDLCNVNDKWMCHALTQGIRMIKTFITYKSATAGKFITKKKKKNASKQCQVLRSLWQNYKQIS